jgi:hypothetical protein
MKERRFPTNEEKEAALLEKFKVIDFKVRGQDRKVPIRNASKVRKSIGTTLLYLGGLL